MQDSERLNCRILGGTYHNIKVLQDKLTKSEKKRSQGDVVDIAVMLLVRQVEATEHERQIDDKAH